MRGTAGLCVCWWSNEHEKKRKLWISSMNVSTDSTSMVGKVVVSVVGTSAPMRWWSA